jgi:(S)-ureidoglycine aminohydrolase
MKPFLLFWGVIWVSVRGVYSQTITSHVFAYTKLPVASRSGYEELTLSEGATRDFSHVLLQVITVLANQPDSPTQQVDEESVLIVKTGRLTLSLGEKRKTLGPGSVVVIMPGDAYRVENTSDQPLTYYLMRYTSNEMPDLDLDRLKGHSFWVDWGDVRATETSRGSIQQAVNYPTIMSNRLAIQVTSLNPGLSDHAEPAHRAAELLLVLDHPVQITIEGAIKEVQAGDLVFIESEIAHRIGNTNQQRSTYLSIQF